jgi:hypothetical protein
VQLSGEIKNKNKKCGRSALCLGCSVCR